MKRTPLFSVHQRHGGKLIEFGGWEMPVCYTGINEEHQAVRNAAGIFDISHMGEVLVNGPAAEAFLNQTLTNDIRKLTPGTGQYTLMCNEQGGVVDDLYVYQLEEQEYLLIINASRADADFAWLEKQSQSSSRNADVTLKNTSEVTGAVSVQGPKVAGFIDDCFKGPSSAGLRASSPRELKKNQVGRFVIHGGQVWVARTGYTGEDGFEIVAPAEMLTAVWERLLEAGAPYGLKPAGLGARDTLRTEMCYPLYGHELNESTTPIEAGLGFFVSLDKGQFTGRDVLARQKTEGPPKRLAPFKLTERGAPPRPQYPVWSAGPNSELIGKVVSGTQSPSLNVGIGMAYVRPDSGRPGTLILIEARGRKYPAAIVQKPIYRKSA